MVERVEEEDKIEKGISIHKRLSPTGKEIRINLRKGFEHLSDEQFGDFVTVRNYSCTTLVLYRKYDSLVIENPVGDVLCYMDDVDGVERDKDLEEYRISIWQEEGIAPIHEWGLPKIYHVMRKGESIATVMNVLDVAEKW